MMQPVEPDSAYASPGYVRRFRSPPAADEVRGWEQVFVEGASGRRGSLTQQNSPTTHAPVRIPEIQSPVLEMAGIMDGALSGPDSDTVNTLAASLMISTAVSPTVSASETLVDASEHRSRTQYTSLYDDKKQWLKAKTAVYVGNLAARAHTLRTYYKAIIWSLLLMLPVILVGYAQNLAVSLLAQPQFEERFSGDEDDFGAAWMLAVQMCSVGSSMLGGLLFSVRHILATSLMLFLGCTFINFWAPSMAVILAGTLLQGLCSGGFGTLASTYISDVCTPTISNVLTGMISCCWIVGQLTSYGVLWLMVDVEGAGAYRIPMALQWVIPVPIAIACLAAPSSPWWHVRRGNTADALHALERLTCSPDRRRSRFGIHPTDPAVLRLAEIQAVVALETAQLTDKIEFRECFRKSNRRRTEIAVMVNVGQIVVGFAIASQLVNFMRLAGLKSDDSIKMAFFNAIILLLGSMCYFIFYTRLSTRTMYLGGLVCIWPGQAVLLFGWSFLYGATVGPSTNTIVCDVSSAALRTKTLSLSRMANDMVSLMQSAAGPYMLGHDKGNLQGLTAFPAVGLISIWIIWASVRLPEMKNIPQAVADVLFARRIPARRFQREANRLQVMDGQVVDGQVDAVMGVGGPGVVVEVANDAALVV
ncbi:hypothetical protein SPBR_02474 [Sporothrix brasiliensis 5110]|uniref:Major facilitator superfamily (MFS) profile domain-containing protein n=1 Tax=Sporothrix brasiliensis 5110 TaxID=1398154 RepID=A0A0C2F0Y3_9PEZI|nr:uncharacterized protein SPBR_02474 [Sporothrix brasiliensis 5110]KIH92509.1 hypothetical protein SPBR_02474 [Sporothrix brasiliensis 5110]